MLSFVPSKSYTMAFEISGKLFEIFDTVNITDSFRKREFIVEKTENVSGRDFTDHIKFQCIQERCDLLNNFNVNDEVKISFNIKGRKWEKDGRGGYITNLDCWRIEQLGNAADQPPPYTAADEPPMADGAEDDLPF